MRGFMITEIGKRLDMRKVSGFVAIFVPIGLYVCAITPLANAALYLVIAANTRQDPSKGWYSAASILTKVSARAIAWIGIGVKCL